MYDPCLRGGGIAPAPPDALAPCMYPCINSLRPWLRLLFKNKKKKIPAGSSHQWVSGLARLDMFYLNRSFSADILRGPWHAANLWDE